MRRIRTISFLAGILAALLGSAPLRAQTAPNPQDQIAAASHRALETLRAEIGPEPIGRGATVDDLLQKTMSSKTFMQTLARAQQIGGPRWIDQQTCQVRLEIAGGIVARKLVEIATLDHLESPIPPEVLQYHLRDWDNRTFSATGTSACASAALAVQPADASSGWAGVSAASRRRAVAAARADAAAQVLDTLAPVQLAKGHTVADVLKSPPVHRSLLDWLQDRPVTQVQFLENERVEVTLSIAPDELAAALRDAVERDKALPAINSSAWDQASEEIAARLASSAATGSARAGAVETTQATVSLPANPPSWISGQIDAIGIVHAGHGLKAARAAEADADEKLRGQLRLLPLEGSMTLGQAAQADQEIARAIDRGLGHARTTGAQYLPQGGAKITATLDLQDLWQELESIR